MTTQPQTSASVSPAGAATVVAADAEPVVCPLCDYDLRGLVEPRCPECGYAFDWNDLRDPARRLHKYLFEHHPERNVRSFLRTMLGGLLPRRFWGGLLPSQPSRPRRLFVYALVIVISAILPAAAVALHVVHDEWSQLAANRRMLAVTLAKPGIVALYGKAMNRPSATTQQILDQVAPAPSISGALRNAAARQVFTRVLLAQGALLLWPAFSFAALMIFQISMRRARVRPVHFVRCIVYCADALLWANLLLTILVAGFTLRQILIGGTTRLPDHLEAYGIAASCAFGAALLAFVYRMIVALRKYVRFDHPIATVLASQTIVFLSILIVLVILTNPFRV